MRKLTLHDIEKLFCVADWSVTVAHSRSLWKDSYGRYSALSFFKALALPFLLPIRSEHMLARELFEKAPLAVLCGFLPQHVPTRAMLWHFRHHDSGVFKLFMPGVLVNLALAADQLGLALPSVEQMGSLEPPDIPPYATIDDIAGRRVSIWRNQEERSQSLLFPNDVNNLDTSTKTSAASLYRGLGLPYHIISEEPGLSRRSLLFSKPDWVGTQGPTDTLAPLVPSARLNPYVVTHAIVSNRFEGSRRILAGISRSGSARGTYVLPGGSVIGDESLEACIAREVQEETGLRVSCSRPISFFMTHYAGRPWVLNVVAWAYKYRGVVMNAEPDNFDDWMWLPLEDIPHRLSMDLFPPSLLAIRHFLRRPFGRVSWHSFEENVSGIELGVNQEVPAGSLPLPLWGDPASAIRES